MNKDMINFLYGLDKPYLMSDILFHEPEKTLLGMPTCHITTLYWNIHFPNIKLSAKQGLTVNAVWSKSGRSITHITWTLHIHYT